MLISQAPMNITTSPVHGNMRLVTDAAPYPEVDHASGGTSGSTCEPCEVQASSLVAQAQHNCTSRSPSPISVNLSPPSGETSSSTSECQTLQAGQQQGEHVNSNTENASPSDDTQVEHQKPSLPVSSDVSTTTSRPTSAPSKTAVCAASPCSALNRAAPPVPQPPSTTSGMTCGHAATAKASECVYQVVANCNILAAMLPRPAMALVSSALLASGSAMPSLLPCAASAGSTASSVGLTAETAALAAAVAASKLGLTDQLKAALATQDGLINCRDSEGRTCLHYAAGYGYEDCVDVLLAMSADTRGQDCNGDVPLHFAAIHGHPMCAYNIAKACTSACLTKNKSAQTPIDVAVACERPEVLNAMLLACAGDTSEASVHAMRKLLKDGAVPDTWAPNGSSALMLAASVDGVAALKVLLAAGASIELQDALGRSALMFAAGNCAQAALVALLNAGANMALRDRRGRSVIEYAPEGSAVKASLQERLRQLEVVARQHQDDLLASLEEPSGKGTKGKADKDKAGAGGKGGVYPSASTNTTDPGTRKKNRAAKKAAAAAAAALLTVSAATNHATAASMAVQLSEEAAAAKKAAAKPATAEVQLDLPAVSAQKPATVQLSVAVKEFVPSGSVASAAAAKPVNVPISAAGTPSAEAGVSVANGAEGVADGDVQSASWQVVGSRNGRKTVPASAAGSTSGAPDKPPLPNHTIIAAASATRAPLQVPRGIMQPDKKPPSAHDKAMSAGGSTSATADRHAADQAIPRPGSAHSLSSLGSCDSHSCSLSSGGSSIQSRVSQFSLQAAAAPWQPPAVKTTPKPPDSATMTSAPTSARAANPTLNVAAPVFTPPISTTPTANEVPASTPAPATTASPAINAWTVRKATAAASSANSSPPKTRMASPAGTATASPKAGIRTTGVATPVEPTSMHASPVRSWASTVAAAANGDGEHEPAAVATATAAAACVSSTADDASDAPTPAPLSSTKEVAPVAAATPTAEPVENHKPIALEQQLAILASQVSQLQTQLSQQREQQRNQVETTATATPAAAVTSAAPATAPSTATVDTIAPVSSIKDIKDAATTAVPAAASTPTPGSPTAPISAASAKKLAAARRESEPAELAGDTAAAAGAATAALTKPVTTVAALASLANVAPAPANVAPANAGAGAGPANAGAGAANAGETLTREQADSLIAEAVYMERVRIVTHLLSLGLSPPLLVTLLSPLGTPEIPFMPAGPFGGGIATPSGKAPVPMRTGTRSHASQSSHDLQNTLEPTDFNPTQPQTNYAVGQGQLEMLMGMDNTGMPINTCVAAGGCRSSRHGSYGEGDSVPAAVVSTPVAGLLRTGTVPAPSSLDGRESVVGMSYGSCGTSVAGGDADAATAPVPNKGAPMTAVEAAAAHMAAMRAKQQQQQHRDRMEQLSEMELTERLNQLYRPTGPSQAHVQSVQMPQMSMNEWEMYPGDEEVEWDQAEVEAAVAAAAAALPCNPAEQDVHIAMAAATQGNSNMNHQLPPPAALMAAGMCEDHGDGVERCDPLPDCGDISLALAMSDDDEKDPSTSTGGALYAAQPEPPVPEVAAPEPAAPRSAMEAAMAHMAQRRSFDIPSGQANAGFVFAPPATMDDSNSGASAPVSIPTPHACIAPTVPYATIPTPPVQASHPLAPWSHSPALSTATGMSAPSLPPPSMRPPAPHPIGSKPPPPGFEEHFHHPPVAALQRDSTGGGAADFPARASWAAGHHIHPSTSPSRQSSLASSPQGYTAFNWGRTMPPPPDMNAHVPPSTTLPVATMEHCVSVGGTSPECSDVRAAHSYGAPWPPGQGQDHIASMAAPRRSPGRPPACPSRPLVSVLGFQSQNCTAAPDAIGSNHPTTNASLRFSDGGVYGVLESESSTSAPRLTPRGGLSGSMSACGSGATSHLGLLPPHDSAPSTYELQSVMSQLSAVKVKDGKGADVMHGITAPSPLSTHDLEIPPSAVRRSQACRSGVASPFGAGTSPPMPPSAFAMGRPPLANTARPPLPQNPKEPVLKQRMSGPAALPPTAAMPLPATANTSTTSAAAPTAASQHAAAVLLGSSFGPSFARDASTAHQGRHLGMFEGDGDRFSSVRDVFAQQQEQQLAETLGLLSGQAILPGSSPAEAFTWGTMVNGADGVHGSVGGFWGGGAQPPSHFSNGNGSHLRHGSDSMALHLPADGLQLPECL